VDPAQFRFSRPGDSGGPLQQDPPFFVCFELFVSFVLQKSNCALIFANRAAMIDAGFKYVGP
jgi:hypothetical protein